MGNYFVEMSCNIVSDDGNEEFILVPVNFYSKYNYEMHLGQSFDSLYKVMQKYINEVKPGYNVDDAPESIDIIKNIEKEEKVVLLPEKMVFLGTHFQQLGLSTCPR